MSKIEVDTIDTQTASGTLQVGSTNTSLIKIGTSGDTVEYPAGTTFTQSGTQNVTSGGAINIKSGGSIIIDSGAAITNNGTATGFSADLTNLNATNLTSGTVPNARYGTPTFSGANLTNLNATALTSGTLPDARFPATLPAVSGANLTNLPAGGKINQVIYHSNATMSSMNSSSFAAISGYSVAITPSASDSRIFLTYYLSVGLNQDSYAFFQAFRDTTKIQSQNNAGSRIGCTVAHGRNSGSTASAQTMTVCFNIVDSPNTTNEVTYTVKASTYDNSTMTFNKTPNDSNNSQAARPTSGITAMEVLA